jgi:hypothetical protein
MSAGSSEIRRWILVAAGRLRDETPYYVAEKGEPRMGKVVVINGVTLDGVMQSPGRAEEDTRGGFTHGGWAAQYVDDQALAAIQARVAEGGGLQLLLGRRSYEEMLGYWNTQGRSFQGWTEQRPEVRGLENAARAADLAELDPAPRRRRRSRRAT